MTGLELTAKIYAKEIENGTKIKAIVPNGYTVDLTFENDMLNWKTGTFGTGFLFDKNVKFEIVEEKPKGWFKPEEDDKYYFIDAYNEIDYCYWNNDVIDDNRYNNHNCFRSEEEAWEYKEYKEALRKVQKPFEVGQLNYGMIYDFRSKKIDIFWTGDCVRQGTSYLGQDKEVAQAFIDEWKDCILKYEFDVWE